MSAHLRYLSYVVRHKWFVLLAGLRVRAPLWRLLIHDWSKFTPSEWGPYVRFFYTKPRPGETVSGVADNAPFEGTVVATRPAKNVRPGEVDCLIRDGRGTKDWWAWSFEVGRRHEVQDAFDRAWLHHQHANAHHWQHWMLREDSGAVKLLPMPEPLAREMVADWMGAGRAITGRWEVAEWYKKNRDIIQLAPGTRSLVDRLILARAPRTETEDQP